MVLLSCDQVLVGVVSILAMLGAVDTTAEAIMADTILVMDFLVVLSMCCQVVNTETEEL